MIRKRYQEAKSGLQLVRSQKFLRKIGLGKEDRYFWRQWTVKPRPKEEKELAYLYEGREFPCLGDEEAMEYFIAKGGMIRTMIGLKGMVELEEDSSNYQKDLQKKNFDQESQKLWLRMRNEFISELQEKGYDVK